MSPRRIFFYEWSDVWKYCFSVWIWKRVYSKWISTLFVFADVFPSTLFFWLKRKPVFDSFPFFFDRKIFIDTSAISPIFFFDFFLLQFLQFMSCFYEFTFSLIYIQKIFSFKISSPISWLNWPTSVDNSRLSAKEKVLVDENHSETRRSVKVGPRKGTFSWPSSLYDDIMLSTNPLISNWGPWMRENWIPNFVLVLASILVFRVHPTF